MADLPDSTECGAFLPGPRYVSVMSDRPTVGVVGPETAAVERAVGEAGGDPATGTAAAVVGEAEYVVAVGEPALLAVARADPTGPVLPVAAGRGVRSVPRGRVEEALAALLSGEFDRVEQPRLSVSIADRSRARVLADLMLVSAEPAQISEYTVRSGGERVAQFRADGVVVATPAGSTGYARAADGPVVPPGVDGLVVVPVAPFSTDVDHWVLPQTGLGLTVERDETAVHLIADDRVVGPVEPDEPVDVTVDGAVETAVVAASRSCFDRGD